MPRADHDDGGTARPLLWMTLALAFVVLSPVASEAARSSTGNGALTFTVISIVCTALAFLSPQVRQVAASRSEASAEEREIDADLRAQMAQVVPLVLKTAAELIGPDRSRACWFPLQAGPPTRLTPADFAGRAGSPSTVFEEGTQQGDTAFGMLTLDATEPGSLRVEDAGLLRLMAGVLAVALGMP